MNELLVVIEGEIMGRVRADRAGCLTFTYDDAWLAHAKAHSLSVSMPLAKLVYPQRVVLPYLWNLLPENPNVLQRWGQLYHVSAANPFKLLAHVGADVPGAAQLVPADELDAIRSEPRAIDWMQPDELAERLLQLRLDATAIRRPGDIGKMSLPGAQAKTAFYWDEQTGRWGVPGGRVPTTHIIKPCVPGFDGLVENEHLCQDIAARFGIPAARSRVLHLDQTYIVVERFDRLPSADTSSFVRRVHQEDLCQALALGPAKKYQEDGGPGIAAIVALIRRVGAAPDADVDRFLQANMLNWLIGGTDAHAKNYSLLIGAADEIRLAPLYDLSSQLPYTDLVPQRVSMKIGDHYDIPLIDMSDWRKLARTCAVSEERVIEMLEHMCSALPDHICAARDQAIAERLRESVVQRLAALLIGHVRERRAQVIGRG